MQLKSNIKLEDQEYATKIRKHNFSKYLVLVFLRDMNEGNLSLEDFDEEQIDSHNAL